MKINIPDRIQYNMYIAGNKLYNEFIETNNITKLRDAIKAYNVSLSSIKIKLIEKLNNKSCQ
jgi:hypothetical protein